MTASTRIIHGDCLDILKDLPSASADLILTDPPYFVRYRDRFGRSIANDIDPESVLGAFGDLYRILKPNRFRVCFYGWSKVDAFFNAWSKAGFRPVGHLVWRKDYASNTGFVSYHHEQAYLLAKGNPPKPKCLIADVQPWEYSGNRIHPTEKAVSILHLLCARSRSRAILSLTRSPGRAARWPPPLFQAVPPSESSLKINIASLHARGWLAFAVTAVM